MIEGDPTQIHTFMALDTVRDQTGVFASPYRARLHAPAPEIDRAAVPRGPEAALPMHSN